MDQQAEEIGWVEQALRGDRAAFSQLMHRYAGAVYNLAYRMLGNAEDAEDASQEIFLRAYTRVESFDRRRRCLSWLTLDDAAFALPSKERSPERIALDLGQQGMVQRALQPLPENYRT